jgi:hypothetical protein
LVAGPSNQTLAKYRRAFGVRTPLTKKLIGLVLVATMPGESLSTKINKIDTPLLLTKSAKKWDWNVSNGA